MSRAEDLGYMEMAFGLAAKALGRASPNPYVGAVLVRGGEVVGSGWHEGPGKPHAEVIALGQAGRRAKGACLYVTLEPCVHWGRTPPCIGPVLAAGLKRAVISDLDPNPLVNGRGVSALRRAGLEVEAGLLEPKNRTLNEAYFKFIRRRRPFVTLKAAATLDGRVAARNLSSRWISSATARDYSHLLRAEQDAILAGIGTILRDDPRLTVRHPLWPGKKVVRAVLDSRLRLPLESRLLETLRAGPLLIFTGPAPPRDKARRLENQGVEIIPLPRGKRGLPLPSILDELGRRETAGLLVEGGSAVSTAFLDEHLADKLFLTLSPKLFGGRRSPSFFEGRGVAGVPDALRLERARIFEMGGEVYLEGYL